MELDILEKNVIAAISKCSVFSFIEVQNVYKEVKSFDKTIKVLNLVVSKDISFKEGIQLVNAREISTVFIRTKLNNDEINLIKKIDNKQNKNY